jgi:hypothetical protein
MLIFALHAVPFNFVCLFETFDICKRFLRLADYVGAFINSTCFFEIIILSQIHLYFKLLWA